MSRRRYSCAHSRMLARRRRANRVVSGLLLAGAIAGYPAAANALSSFGGAATGNSAAAVATQVGSQVALTDSLDGALPTRISLVADTRHRDCMTPELELEGIPCDASIVLTPTSTGFVVTVSIDHDSATFIGSVR